MTCLANLGPGRNLRLLRFQGQIPATQSEENLPGPRVGQTQSPAHVRESVFTLTHPPHVTHAHTPAVPPRARGHEHLVANGGPHWGTMCPL